MTEAQNIPPQENHFNSASDYYLTPYDLRNDRVLQFIALEAMGYPVRFEQLPVEKAFKNPVLKNDDSYTRWVRTFPVWVRPIVTVDSFAQYVEEPDVLGDVFNPSNEEIFPEEPPSEIRSTLEDHIAEINFAIDSGQLNTLADYLERQERGEGKRWFKDITATPFLRITEEEVLLRAFATGIIRRKRMEEAGYTFSGYFEQLHPETLELAEYVERIGTKPLDVEAQIGLVVDYYQLIECLVPQFAEYKRK